MEFSGENVQPQTLHSKTFHNKILEFLGRGCFYCRIHRESGTKAQHQRKIGLKTWNCVSCSGLFRAEKSMKSSSEKRFFQVLLPWGSLAPLDLWASTSLSTGRPGQSPGHQKPIVLKPVGMVSNLGGGVLGV